MAQTMEEIIATCEKHGEYAATTTTTIWVTGSEPHIWTTTCPNCKREREEEEKERQRRARVAANRYRACIPARFASATLENYATSNEGQKRALVLAKGFAENFATVREAGSSLTFYGKPGCGKTHLACAVANQILDAGRTVIYQQAIELVRAIRNTWRRESDQSETTVIEKYRRTDLLIVDEIGVSLGGEAEKTQVFDVLDGRYREMRPTLIVSNLSLKGLQECLGERIYDRLMQNGSGCVPFNWGSYRPLAPATKKPAGGHNDGGEKSLSERLAEMGQL